MEKNAGGLWQKVAQFVCFVGSGPISRFAIGNFQGRVYTSIVAL